MSNENNQPGGDANSDNYDPYRDPESGLYDPYIDRESPLYDPYLDPDGDWNPEPEPSPEPPPDESPEDMECIKKGCELIFEEDGICWYLCEYECPNGTTYFEGEEGECKASLYA